MHPAMTVARAAIHCVFDPALTSWRPDPDCAPGLWLIAAAPSSELSRGLPRRLYRDSGCSARQQSVSALYFVERSTRYRPSCREPQDFETHLSSSQKRFAYRANHLRSQFDLGPRQLFDGNPLSNRQSTPAHRPMPRRWRTAEHSPAPLLKPTPLSLLGYPPQPYSLERL